MNTRFTERGQLAAKTVAYCILAAVVIGTYLYGCSGIVTVMQGWFTMFSLPMF